MRAPRSVCALAWIFILCSSCAAQTFDGDGPHQTDGAKFNLDLPETSSKLKTISVTVTFPATSPGQPGSSISQVSEEVPSLVFFISGFKLRSTYYTAYAQRLASWGYFVVQYDTSPWWQIVPDKDELSVPAFLVDWLKTQEWSVDVNNVAVVGHSRGAKLAALHVAGGTGISPVAAYLIDPVDCTKFAPHSEDTPCALDLLLNKNKPLAMTGASIRGQCNPLGVGFHSFFNISGPGSWSFELPECGHMKFMDANPVVNKVADALCGGGRSKRQEVRRLTLAPLLGWLELNIRNKQVPEFMQWVRERATEGSFTFEQKAAMQKVHIRAPVHHSLSTTTHN